MCVTAFTVSTPRHLSALGQEAAAQSTEKSSGKTISFVDLISLLFYSVFLLCCDTASYLPHIPEYLSISSSVTQGLSGTCKFTWLRYFHSL